MRLFIALSLPDEVRDRLAAISGGIPGARCVEPENLHLTLRFLGEVDNGLARDVDNALTQIDVEAFELTLSGLGFFTEGKRVITALWAGIESNPPLSRLQAKVEQAAVRAGLPPERRKFKPHVTLARGRIENSPKLEQFMMSHALLRIGAIPIESFTLYSSHLQPNGAIYSPEVVYPLSRR